MLLSPCRHISLGSTVDELPKRCYNRVPQSIKAKKGQGETMALREEDLYKGGNQTKHSAKRSRITFDVSPELRRRIKMAALQHDLSIGEYLGHILEQAVPDEAAITQRERRYATPETLRRVLRVRERLLQESKGELFEDSAELLRKQREERTRYLEQLGEQE